MSDATFKIVELTGTSPEGVTEAIRNGIQRAGKTLRNLDWFEVQQIRGYLDGDSVQYFQVTMKIGFKLEE